MRATTWKQAWIVTCTLRLEAAIMGKKDLSMMIDLGAMRAAEASSISRSYNSDI